MTMGTIDSALADAQRLLREAEMETDLVKQGQLTAMANTWVDVANSLIEASRV